MAQADAVVYLPGNHELLLADTLEDARRGDGALGSRSPGECWVMNGGMAFTEEAFEAAGREMPRGPADAVSAFAEMVPHPGHDSFDAMVRNWPSQSSPPGAPLTASTKHRRPR
ncbi:hypothetical protein [Tranquillimonas alkanivorans]|uniref:Uncharacterized protein n=1 Tax=Tranquillimonas alkanivorans TaxID=441119 RepID=A0A1I5VZF6_9RHOB|nr:hypothetical protein [Tranquillimonas alkanivorans]SFQ12918.1 hypothetical protein SAMN04488047_1384 [Tranquillimonas alkanivorans]